MKIPKNKSLKYLRNRYSLLYNSYIHVLDSFFVDQRKIIFFKLLLLFNFVQGGIYMRRLSYFSTWTSVVLHEMSQCSIKCQLVHLQPSCNPTYGNFKFRWKIRSFRFIRDFEYTRIH